MSSLTKLFKEISRISVKSCPCQNKVVDLKGTASVGRTIFFVSSREAISNPVDEIFYSAHTGEARTRGTI